MTTVSVPVHVYVVPANEWETGPHIIDGYRTVFFTSDGVSGGQYIKLCEATVNLEMPEGWDPRAQRIAALQARKAEITRAFQAEVEKINTQISKNLAIEHTAA
jgi:hypothetical protein